MDLVSGGFPGVARTEMPVARPPSPPYIHIPTGSSHDNVRGLIPITAAQPHIQFFNLGVSGTSMSRADIQTITGGRNTPQQSYQIPLPVEWTYESRRHAQQILPFLYLGPASAARDRAFLQRNNITLLLAARDARLAAARLLAVGKCAAELGIGAEYVDVSGRQELIAALPLAVDKINAHMLATGGEGKVLVCCETGNDRSATLVAAYVMTMYSGDLVEALQFIQARRFCASFDDEVKFLLRGYGDIVAARRMVGVSAPPSQPVSENGLRMDMAGGGGKGGKRGFADTSMDEDEEASDGPGPESDLERFSGRHLMPFVDNESGGGTTG